MKIGLTIFAIFVLALCLSGASAVDNNLAKEALQAYRDKNYSKAEPLFKSIIQKNPNNLDARMFLAEIYIHEKKTDLSKQEYYKICQISPKSEYCKEANYYISVINSVQFIAKSQDNYNKKSINDYTKGASKCAKNNDGSSICQFPCGGTLTIRNGDKTMKYPDGESMEETSSGKVTIKMASGIQEFTQGRFISIDSKYRTICKPSSDGTNYIERKDGTKEYHYKNGDVKEYTTSGQVLLYTGGTIKTLK